MLVELLGSVPLLHGRVHAFADHGASAGTGSFGDVLACMHELGKERGESIMR